MSLLRNPKNSNNLNFLEDKQKKKTIGRLGECRHSRFSYCSLAPSYGDPYNPNEVGDDTDGGGGDELPVANPLQWLNARTLLDTYTDGEEVDFWNDDSGNSNHAMQDPSNPIPIFKTNIQNGLPAVLFTPTDFERLLCNNFTLALTEGEIFYVFKRNTDVPGVGTSSGFWKMDNQLDACHVPFTDGNIYDAWGTNVRRNIGNPTTDLSNASLYNVVSASGEWTARINNTVFFTTATNTVDFGGGFIYYGASFSGFVGFSYFDGYIMEVIVYDRKLTTPERNAVVAYLNTKWALGI